MLTFRNLTVTPDDPVAVWGVEGMLAAIDRGEGHDWVKLARAVAFDTTGTLRPQLEQAMALAESTSTATLIRNAVEWMARSPRDVAFDRFRDAFGRTRLSVTRAAEELGTSRSRLSSYLNRHVMPSAELLVKMETLADDNARYRAWLLNGAPGQDRTRVPAETAARSH